MDINNATDFGTVKIIMLKGEKGDKGDDGNAGDYSGLINKPSINSITLTGNKTTSDLGLPSLADVQSAQEDALEAKADAQDALDATAVIGTGTLDTVAQTIIPAINELAVDYIVEQGEEDGWSWRKWNSGRYEAEKIWNVGQLTLGNQEVSGFNYAYVSNTLTIPTPPHTLVSGEIDVSYLGNSSGSPAFMERASSTTIRLAKIASTTFILQNNTFAVKVVGGKWK